MHMIENEKGLIRDLNYRATITKVRGGWTEEKIKKDLKRLKGDSSDTSFLREIAKYDTPEEFAENLFYHGSGGSIGVLKPSVVLTNAQLGGGYDDRYFGISLSTDKNIASNFTGASSYGCVAPVLLKRGAIVKKMPEISDSCEINDIIVDLWTEGVDAVIIGDHSKEMSEREIVVLNPKCIAVGPSEYYQVFQKPKMPSLSKDELTNMWLNSSDNYKELSIKSWEESNIRFKEKYGKEKSPETKWHQKQIDLYNFHQHNKEIYENSLKIENSVARKTRKNRI